jgi:hypothetical protein
LKAAFYHADFAKLAVVRHATSLQRSLGKVPIPFFAEMPTPKITLIPRCLASPKTYANNSDRRPYLRSRKIVDPGAISAQSPYSFKRSRETIWLSILQTQKLRMFCAI